MWHIFTLMRRAVRPATATPNCRRSSVRAYVWRWRDRGRDSRPVVDGSTREDASLVRKPMAGFGCDFAVTAQEES